MRAFNVGRACTGGNGRIKWRRRSLLNGDFGTFLWVLKGRNGYRVIIRIETGHSNLVSCFWPSDSGAGTVFYLEYQTIGQCIFYRFTLFCCLTCNSKNYFVYFQDWHNGALNMIKHKWQYITYINKWELFEDCQVIRPLHEIITLPF